MGTFEQSQEACDAIYNDFLLIVRATDGANVGLSEVETDRELLRHRNLLQYAIVVDFASEGVTPTPSFRKEEYPRSGPLG